MDEEIKLDELAERSGFSARTIRLYIAEGLLPGPGRAGPRSSYGREHLERLGEIRHLQARGLTLSEIRRHLEGLAGERTSLPEPEAVQRFQLAPDIVVELRAGMAPWRARAVAKALEQFAAAVRPDKGDNDR